MTESMLSRFKGSMAGGVVGDCIGGVFEVYWGLMIGTDKVLKETKRIDSVAEKMKGDNNDFTITKTKSVWNFTDDTVMARSVAKSLITNNGLNVEDIAKRFTTEYFRDRLRGYGGGVISVFYQLAENEYSDIFGPSRRQFNGQGSYGNGGAMRIAPAGLFVYKKQMEFMQLQDLVQQITLVTHSKSGAILGSILQCYAVTLALKMDRVDVDVFINELLKEIEPLEEKLLANNTSSGDTGTKTKTRPESQNVCTETYALKLETIREFAKREKQPPNDEIDKVLGTDISALRSVPTALYCFLRSRMDIDGVDKECNGFERAIIYAISLGGDTDTIGTMTGAIAGAYYGVEMIPWSWQRCCEGVEDALNDAELLYSLT